MKVRPFRDRWTNPHSKIKKTLNFPYFLRGQGHDIAHLECGVVASERKICSGIFSDSNTDIDTNYCGWRFTDIFEGQGDNGGDVDVAKHPSRASSEIKQPHADDMKVGSSNCSHGRIGGDFAGLRARYRSCNLFLARSPESMSRKPQTAGKYSQNEGEAYKQRVSYLEPVAVERRPKLGSLFGSLFGPLLGFILIGGAGGTSRRWLFHTLVWCGVLIIADSTVGFVLGLDWWSLCFGA